MTDGSAQSGGPTRSALRTRSPSESPTAALRTIQVSVVVVAAFAFLLALRPVPALFDKPLDEDGYYALTIARHLGLGHGLTADGTQPTNGFQPLWVLVCAPLFWIAGGDRVLALRLVIALHWLLFCLSAALTAALARRVFEWRDAVSPQTTAWVAALVFMSAAQGWMNSFNGLETSLEVAVMLATLLWYVSMDRGRATHIVGCGVALGVLVLARIDTVFFVILLSAAQLLRQDPLKHRVLDAARLSIPAFLVSLPWWAYNVIWFRHLTPSSGLALQDWAPTPHRYWVMLTMVARLLTPHLYLSNLESDRTAILRIGILVVAALLAWNPARRILRQIDRAIAEALAVLAVFVAMLALWYATSSWATLFYVRYFATAVILASLFWMLVLVEVLRRLPRAAAQAAIVVIAAQIPLLVAISYVGTAFSGHTMLREQVPLVEMHVPPGDWVAATQSGTLGYLRDRVVNLDGRVNHEALSRQRDLESYVRERHIRWFVDWQTIAIDTLGPIPEQRGWTGVARMGRMSLFRYDGPSGGASPAATRR